MSIKWRRLTGKSVTKRVFFEMRFLHVRGGGGKKFEVPL